MEQEGTPHDVDDLDAPAAVVVVSVSTGRRHCHFDPCSVSVAVSSHHGRQHRRVCVCVLVLLLAVVIARKSGLLLLVPSLPFLLLPSLPFSLLLLLLLNLLLLQVFSDTGFVFSGQLVRLLLALSGVPLFHANPPDSLVVQIESGFEICRELRGVGSVLVCICIYIYISISTSTTAWLTSTRTSALTCCALVVLFLQDGAEAFVPFPEAIVVVPVVDEPFQAPNVARVIIGIVVAVVVGVASSDAG